MPDFGLISEIEIEKKKTWENRIFLTLDVDWASDDVLEYTYQLLENTKIRATWFFTHQSGINQKILANKNFETGIHPNFNKLLVGDFCNGANQDEVTDNCLLLAPGARSVRSHTLFQSSPTLEMFFKKNLKYDLNTFMPIDSGIIVRPYLHWTGIIQLPHIWEDDVHCMYNWNYAEMINLFKSYKGLKILDFHPIHIYLNTETLSRYNNSRHLHRNIEALSEHRYQEYGTETFLKELINYTKNQKITF